MKYDVATPYCAAFVLVEKDGKYLFVKRAHTGWQDGSYGLPSGKLEKDEAISSTAVRETKEEVGLTVRAEDLKQVFTMHRHGEDGTEWMDIVFVATQRQGDPINAEPHKHSEIAWFSLDALPANTVPPVRYMLEQIAAGQTYGEFGWEKL